MLKAFKGAIRKVTLPPLIRWLGRRGFLVLPGKDDHYSQDGLSTIHNHDFLREASFLDAYRKGVEASQGVEQPIHWRLHVALWAASVASRLEGDFVECGVNQGFISSAVMQYLDWDHLGRRFFLLDTFSGPVEDYYSDEEMEAGRVDESRSARLGEVTTWTWRSPDTVSPNGAACGS